jgi:hypothetical protein
MVGATLGIAAFGALFGGLARADLPAELDAAGVSVSADEVETLDAVVTGSEDAREAVDGFAPRKAEAVERAVDGSFVEALGIVLKIGAALQLLAALAAAGLPRGRAREVPATAPAPVGGG